MLLLTKFPFWEEDWALGYNSIILFHAKTTFKKEEPILCKKRDYKKFDTKTFHMDLQNKLHEDSKVYQNSKGNFVRVLDAHAPSKI